MICIKIPAAIVHAQYEIKLNLIYFLYIYTTYKVLHTYPSYPECVFNAKSKL